MLKQQKDQVRAADGRRQQAAIRLQNATQRWEFEKKRFFTNPVNLLLPFTAGALLASRGSATRQVLDWSRIISSVAKVLVTVYPIYKSSETRKRNNGMEDKQTVE